MNNEKWLRNIIAQGLAKLMVLGLPNRPAEEVIKETAKIWLQVLLSQKINWDEAQDKPRLEAAFMLLLSDCDRWPTPKMLLERLPKRKKPEALPPPELTPEQNAKNLARIQELKKFYAKFKCRK